MTNVLLDKLKRSRKAARSAFSKAFSVFNEEINQEEPIYEDVQVAFQILEVRSFELDASNTKICEAMVELTAEKEDHEKIMEDEYEGAAEYTSKYLRAKIEVIKLNKRQNQPEQRQQTFQHAPTTDNDSKRRFKLPKIELKKFGGDLKDWLQFCSQFNNIHDDKSITKEDKFQYLTQAMIPNSRAADLVNSYPPTNDNYDKVIDSLKSRFGKDELLVEVYVRELLTLVINNAIKSNEETSLSKIYDKLEAQLRALESLGVTKDKCAAMLYHLVESSLPEELRRTWQRQATTIKCKDIGERLTKLTEFLQDEVENEERLKMAKKIKTTNETSIPTATGLLTKEGKNVKQNFKTYTCIFCGEEHRSSRCGKAKQMTLDDKWNIVKEKNCCFNCLIPGHNTQETCGKKHSILLCRGILNPESSSRKTAKEDSSKYNKEANLANLSLIPEVCLQTVRVILKNGDEKRIVRAILDSGSQRSYISKRVAEEMNYQSHCKNQVVHLLFGGTKTKPQDHKGYLIHLESLNNQYACNFMAFDQDKICHGIPSINNGPWIQELLNNNIILTDVSQTFDPIDILIGADVLGK
ncbi:uncharacterized protein LOC123301370 [Chrysoperla carnea]|uniref:uncharacterized protein LOC123301370 n=1 Tax=Chrysoperla carnea TaxID=189513 RepID=UPI001D0871C1|nr:uncharacterized protein LOC123301370 [Chrysoperla carnea]